MSEIFSTVLDAETMKKYILPYSELKWFRESDNNKETLTRKNRGELISAWDGEWEC